MHLASLSSRVFGIFEVRDLNSAYSNWNRLHDCLIFSLFYRITYSLVIPMSLSVNVYTLILLCVPFAHFTVAVLTCYYFTSYSILLHMCIYAWVFHTLSFFCVFLMSLLKLNVQILSYFQYVLTFLTVLFVW